MGKNNAIKELTKLLTYAIIHKIGSIVNKDAVYSDKYLKESENFLRMAEEAANKENWNSYDKLTIKKNLQKAVHDELLKRNFLCNKKFDIIEREINNALEILDLV